MAAAPVIVATYAEIALKGRNRTVFLRKLLNNMPHGPEGRTAGRNRPRREPSADPPGGSRGRRTVTAKVKTVFGLQWVSPANPMPRTDLDREIAEDLAAGREPRLTSLCAEACALTPPTSAGPPPSRSPPGAATTPSRWSRRRSAASWAARSTWRSGCRPAWHDPDFLLHVLVLKDLALVFCAKERACGGLPAGSSGRIMVLLSGGIDSPVAAWMMMRRGCRPTWCTSTPGRNAEEADTRQDRGPGPAPGPLLARFRCTLYLVPVVPYEMRAMGAIADTLRHGHVPALHGARRPPASPTRTRCLAVVTGDSLGQVASQTLHNLAAIAPDVRLPILRPLIGMDKHEITAWSRQIGPVRHLHPALPRLLLDPLAPPDPDGPGPATCCAYPGIWIWTAPCDEALAEHAQLSIG